MGRERSLCLSSLVNDNTSEPSIKMAARALFDDETFNLLISTSKFGDWSKRFCETTGLPPTWCSQTRKQAGWFPLTPRASSHSFYVNQDGSWQSDWNTFGGMKRFSAPFKPILEYFTGVCPPEYFTASAERSQYSTGSLEEHRREYRLLERAIGAI